MAQAFDYFGPHLHHCLNISFFFAAAAVALSTVSWKSQDSFFAVKDKKQKQKKPIIKYKTERKKKHIKQ